MVVEERDSRRHDRGRMSALGKSEPSVKNRSRRAKTIAFASISTEGASRMALRFATVPRDWRGSQREDREGEGSRTHLDPQRSVDARADLVHELVPDLAQTSLQDPGRQLILHKRAKQRRTTSCFFSPTFALAIPAS